MSDWDVVSRALDEVIDLAPSSRATRMAAWPAPLQREVASLLEAHDRAGDFLADRRSPESHPLQPGDVLGAWRVVDLIGQGGMGAVYRAVRDDGQFEMTAAIKVIATGLLTHDAAARFREERQILASLDHSSIARLLDGGVDSTGRPFLVMELVEGVPITTFLRGQPRAAQTALLRTVAGAVHYAHQRLVVHRDIKPGNVLVTSDGTAKLVDFGIARPLEASAAVSWFQPITPEYASPEQLRGDSVSTAADVWSLGALSYEVLAGRPPFDLRGHSVAEALAIVERSVPAPPVDDDDLTAIVRRAMAVDPAARYGSPAELAADLARYERGEPVEARHGGWRYVAGKYLRRHRVGAALAGAAILAVAIAAGAALWQARVAERAQRLAERRFADVRGLAATLIFGVHDRIANLPGSVGARKYLVEQGLAYLDRLAPEAAGDVALERELAHGYLRLGEVLGRPGGFNLGDTAGAVAAFDKARAIAARLVTSRGAPLEDRRLLAAILGRIAEVSIAQRRPEAVEQARAAVAVFEDLAPEAMDTDTALSLAGARFMFASAKGTLTTEPVTDDWKAALAIYDRLRARDPQNDELRRNAALVHKNLGAAELLAHHDAESLVHVEAALAIDRERVAAAPSSPSARLDLSFDLAAAGQALFNRGDAPGAVERYRETVAVRQGLADEDAQDVRARGRLVYAEVRLGQALRFSGRRAEARAQVQSRPWQMPTVCSRRRQTRLRRSGSVRLLSRSWPWSRMTAVTISARAPASRHLDRAFSRGLRSGSTRRAARAGVVRDRSN